MHVLVLGGTGFIGRHAALALLARGHAVTLGTRAPRRAPRRLPGALRGCALREAHFESLTTCHVWKPLLAGVDAVLNAVGILRERGAETYERVHAMAPGALAHACGDLGLRVVHVSALGLTSGARSWFLRSKLAGERAIAATAADWCIVRPSLLDGEDGYGARWLRRMACLPLHLVPADARGRMAVLDVRDLGDALAALCEMSGETAPREVELGGTARHTMAEHLAALRAARGARPALQIGVPAPLARAASHLCDLLHVTPFSFGHLELMRRDNAPAQNLLQALIGRAPAPVGRAPASARPAPGLAPIASGR